MSVSIADMQYAQMDHRMVPYQKLMDTLLDETLPVAVIESEISLFFQLCPAQDYAASVSYAIDYVGIIRPKIRRKYIPIFTKIQIQNNVHNLKLVPKILSLDIYSRTVFLKAVSYYNTTFPIERAIQKDNLEEVQAIISRSLDFDIGDCNYINEAAYYGSVQCFKYFFLNRVKALSNTHTFAVCGGNTEIIRILHVTQGEEFTDRDLLVSVLYHRNQITDWLISEGKGINSMDIEAAQSYNFRAFQYFKNISTLHLWGQSFYVCKDVYNLPLIQIYIEDSNSEHLSTVLRAMVLSCLNTKNEAVLNFVAKRYPDKFDHVTKKLLNIE